MATTRRELIQRVSMVLGSAGVAGTAEAAVDVQEASLDPRRTLVVVTFPGGISQDTAQRLMDQWDRSFIGTPWEHVRCVVLGDGGRAEILKLPEP